VRTGEQRQVRLLPSSAQHSHRQVISQPSARAPLPPSFFSPAISTARVWFCCSQSMAIGWDRCCLPR
jgi:hypothetical protein